MAHNSKINIGNAGSEDDRPELIKFEIRQKFECSKLISTCPENYFQRFFFKNPKLFSDYEHKNFCMVVKTAL